VKILPAPPKGHQQDASVREALRFAGYPWDGTLIPMGVETFSSAAQESLLQSEPALFYMLLICVLDV